LTATAQALRFQVIGDPMTQGSKTGVLGHDGRVRVLEGKGVGRDRHRSWRDSVAWEASRQVGRNGGCFTDGPLECGIWFRLPMPLSRPKRDQVRGWLWAYRGLDLDKLQRSTFDALKDGGLIVDDSRIVLVTAGKVEVPAPEWTGAVITVAPAVLDMTGTPWAAEDAA
jgi:Holliday junction resolvase RusA-like endonuclease